MRKKIKFILTEEVVTIAEAGAIANLAPGTIKTMVVRGNIEAIKKGKTWLLDRKDVEKKKRA